VKLTELSEILRASVSIKKELSEMVQDLIKRDGLTEEAIIQKVDAHALIDDSSLRLPQKCQQLRWRLRKLRYPHLAQAEERFLQTKKKLQLPESRINSCDSLTLF